MANLFHLAMTPPERRPSVYRRLQQLAAEEDKHAQVSFFNIDGSKTVIIIRSLEDFQEALSLIMSGKEPIFDLVEDPINVPEM